MQFNPNCRFPVRDLRIIEKTKNQFSAKVYKDTFVSSNQLRNIDGIIINKTNIQTQNATASTTSCQSNDPTGSAPVNIGQLYTAYQYNNIQNQTFNIKPVIAVVDYNSAENLQSSLDTFCQTNNIPSTTLTIIPIGEPPSTTDGEQYADTQLIHANCINAEILVIQAESSSIQNMAVAIEIAKSYKPNIINMSWGVDEASFTKSEYENLSNLFTGDIIYCAASGDSGTEYVAWPSTDGNVVAVGATSLILNTDNTILKQIGWGCSGRGESQYSTKPYYQTLVDTKSNNRSTCDLSSNGNPYSGISINVNGNFENIGGSSVAAPQISGLFGLVNGYLLNNDKKLYTSIATDNSCIQNLLYQAVNQSDYNSLFYDVSQGIDNIISIGKYSANIQWDNASGCGTPYASPLFSYLTESSESRSSVENNDVSIQEPTPSRIVQNPRLWPSSFSRPEISQNTCIRIYIFKDGTKVEKFLDFVNKTLPNRKVDIKQLEDGKVSISLTESKSRSATNYEIYNFNPTCPLTGCKQIIYVTTTLSFGTTYCTRKQTKYCASLVNGKRLSCTTAYTIFNCNNLTTITKKN